MSIKVSKPDDDLKKGLARARDELKAPREPSVKCPDCGSTRVWKNGFRRLPNDKKVQTYMCAVCYRKFIDPFYNSKRNLNGQAASGHNFSEPMEVKDFYSSNSYPTSEDEDQGKAGAWSETGGLVLEKPLQKSERPAGGTEKSVENLLLGFGLWLLKQGKSERTVKNYIEYLRMLMSRGADLMDPERPFFPWVC